MSTHTATVEALTAEVRVLMVGSRQVTLSVYRQLDRLPSNKVKPFGRVSDKQDKPEHGYRSVFVVGCEITTGVLVRSEHFVERDLLRRQQELVNRRKTNESRRAYGNDPRKSVEPFAVEARVGDRRENRQRRLRMGSGVWLWTETTDDYVARLTARQADDDQYDEWIDLPLIVLAGLR